ncbi:NADH dehydrogenase [ubiquinone] 1 alpha subcomplex assembly factor 3-like [Ylistrum balloti]|uniref:NADH dehydrogenase [ubiquinone] 1 alpha subcomplex assembly factor 3-like n=1 Tax=Ylistrum balloti TaxID=509963 RepID=UPI002905EEA8|nr:NADH dehydrogenase [ubiquinone] 1 alpha subcomplex assembly factor 3-like [Ylistrum balloti]
MTLTSRALWHFSRRLMPCSSATVRGMCDRSDFASTKMKSMFAMAEEKIIISSFSNLGFKISPGIQVVGPITVFPNTVLHWNVKSAKHIDKHSLSLFYMLEPKLDMLVIGKGMATDKVNPDIQIYMKKKGINVEILPTEEACGLFNMLSAEDRHVAAALIPPEKIPFDSDKVSL